VVSRVNKYLDEKSVKLALFATGSETIRLKLEEQLGENVEEFKPIMREAPIPWDRRYYDKIPVNTLYRTGRTIYRLDALYYGRVDGTSALFPVEFKLGEDVTQDAANQIITYAIGLPVLLKSDMIGYPARIFKNYIEIVLSYRGVALEELKGKIRVQPVIIQVGGYRLSVASSFDKQQVKVKGNLRTMAFDVIYSDGGERRRKRYYSYVSKELEEFLEQNLVRESLFEIPVIHLKWEDVVPM